MLIRIPHQTIISTEVTSVTKFPIRRLDIELGVAYKENIEILHPHGSICTGESTKAFPVQSIMMADHQGDQNKDP